jgi:acyl-coenzyme A synthetase/AMP-(fatty) acid ligase
LHIADITMSNENLFCALRAAFPADLSGTAIECADGPSAGARYSWADLERGTAMLANLLASLGLPEGSRVAVQTEKSVEALMLYLAVLRAGYVFLPLNTAYQAAEIEYFIANAEPAVVVCAPSTSPGSAASPSPPARPMSTRWARRVTARCSTAPRTAVTSTRRP